MAVVVSEILNTIRTVVNTMSYSDKINIVSNSDSRSFNEKKLMSKEYMRALVRAQMQILS